MALLTDSGREHARIITPTGNDIGDLPTMLQTGKGQHFSGMAVNIEQTVLFGARGVSQGRFDHRRHRVAERRRRAFPGDCPGRLGKGRHVVAIRQVGGRRAGCQRQGCSRKTEKQAHGTIPDNGPRMKRHHRPVAITCQSIRREAISLPEYVGPLPLGRFFLASRARVRSLIPSATWGD